MAVLLPNARARVVKRAHPQARDARGVPYAEGDVDLPAPGPFLPAGAVEGPDTNAETGITWDWRLDPSTWPVEEGDQVETDDGRVWVITTARLQSIVGHPEVDYVEASAVLDPPKVP